MFRGSLTLGNVLRRFYKMNKKRISLCLCAFVVKNGSVQWLSNYSEMWIGCSAVRIGRWPEHPSQREGATTEQFCTMGVQIVQNGYKTEKRCAE